MARQVALIVDDDAGLREAVADLLTDLGYETAVATDGADALEKLELTGVPSLIILDLLMPRMTGWHLISRLRDLPNMARVPVIGMSGAALGQESDRRELMAFEAFLPKPFSIEQLEQAIMTASAGTPVKLNAPQT